MAGGRATQTLLTVWVALVCYVRAQVVVNVPTGSTTVFMGDAVDQEVKCQVLANTSFGIALTISDGNNRTKPGLVDPSTLWFANEQSEVPELQTREFVLRGQQPGRFYLSYRFVGNATGYKLRVDRSTVVITERSQGWEGIWYEFVFNVVIFMMGVAFFAWRRLHRVTLPFWERHEGGLFERVNYEELDEEAFNSIYQDISGATLSERISKFWRVPSDGKYICNTSGIPAALDLRFHLDAGHLFAIMTVFSVGVMLPVNYLSGESDKKVPGNSFQQTTISNVPLRSAWFWIHVLYCYLVAALVMGFIIRQKKLLQNLRRQTRNIIGERSIFIRYGLPANTTSTMLREMLSTYYPEGIEEVSVIYDLSKLHSILQRRRDASEMMNRMRELDFRYDNGTVPQCLLWCPGSVMVPNPYEVVRSYACCRPCRYHIRNRCSCVNQTSCCCCCFSAVRDEYISRDYYTEVRGDQDIKDEDTAKRVQSIEEELDFFPEEALTSYEQRQCAGCAFIVFDSTETRDDFVRLCRAQSRCGRVINAFSALLNRAKRRKWDEERDRRPSQLLPHLSQLMIAPAPEPDDVIWQNLKYHPFSLRRLLSGVMRQIVTIILLLLFSTPTAVLVFVKLDSNSGVYRELYAQHSALITMVATYLPSLLLIVVNWLLLNFLFLLAMLKPSYSESKRIRTFVVTGFIYLFVSSVFLPCIGVTAAYLAFNDIKNDQHTYVESFLYKLSGTFFISYICQRTFLGAVLELTRAGERFLYQPWVKSRSITSNEKREAARPWPYYFGHDYAVILSVFLVVLLGTMITPIITPFGALYFYVKHFTEKYVFLYIVPYTPGRGHIAETSFSITFACLILFEFVMAFVLAQVGNNAQFVAVCVLIAFTFVFYYSQVVGMTQTIKKTISDLTVEQPKFPRYSTTTPTRRSVSSTEGGDQRQELNISNSYTDPFKVALSIFKLLGVNRFHQMSSKRTQLRYALYRLQRNAKQPQSARVEVSED